MLDIKFIREHPEQLNNALKNRNVIFDVEYLLVQDARRRAKIMEVDRMRQEQNILAKEIARMKDRDREKKKAEGTELKTRLANAEFELKVLEEEFADLMHQIPNIPADEVPVGRNAKENKILREVGEKPRFAFTPVEYMKLSEYLDVIDVARAAKVSGSRFGYLKNEAALLEFALVQLAYELLVKKGYRPIVPPVLITQEMMQAMGYVDSKKDQEERYFLPQDNLYFVGTAEQSLGPMHAGEIFEESSLPMRYAGFSTCFRREAGSYGKDTHGILRVHQFDKIEMFVFADPEQASALHQEILAIEEELMQMLEIPYRVVVLCTGDLSAPSAVTYDIEAWLPGQNGGVGEYRETHSCSNTTDFQARRLNIRVRRSDGSLVFAHLLNGTVFAIGRTIIAILENYQQEDGSVKIPEALQPYMHGITHIRS